METYLVIFQHQIVCFSGSYKDCEEYINKHPDMMEDMKIASESEWFAQ